MMTCLNGDVTRRGPGGLSAHHHDDQGETPRPRHAARTDAMPGYGRGLPSDMRAGENAVKDLTRRDWDEIIGDVNGDDALRGLGVSIDLDSGVITGSAALVEEISHRADEILKRVESDEMVRALEDGKARCSERSIKPRSRKSVDEAYDALVGEIAPDASSIRGMVGDGVGFHMVDAETGGLMRADGGPRLKVTGTDRRGFFRPKRIIYVEDESGRNYEVTACAGAQPSAYYAWKKYEIGGVISIIQARGYSHHHENPDWDDDSAYHLEDRQLIDGINKYTRAVYAGHKTAELMGRWPDHSDDALSDGASRLEQAILACRSGMVEVHYEERAR